MKNSSILFWNVDTQNDFVEPWGKLYVQGAELLKPVWDKITRLAKKHKIRVVNSADFHYIHSPEISDTPDMVQTFPPHCLAGTTGAALIAETNPEDPVIFNWDSEYNAMALEAELAKSRNIVIRKDLFDVFAGNNITQPIVDFIKPEIVVVYGVTTNVCVDYAVMGLAPRVKEIYVVQDAIKELPKIPMPFKKWEKLGVKMISSDELEESFS